MDQHGGNILTKVMGVGMIGVLASMGMLLFTLRAAKPVGEVRTTEVLSPLAFDACLHRGEVLECSYAEGRLSGIRRGVGAERVPFRVEGKIESRLIERIIRNGTPLRRPGPRAPGGARAPNPPRG